MVLAMQRSQSRPFFIALALAGMAASLASLGGCDPSDETRAGQPIPATARGERPFRHVLIISVDGLRPDALEPPFLASLPSFARLLRGPHTLDARTDADITVTLPNHTGMLTGRPFDGPNGHGWKLNDDPPGRAQGGTLHAMKGAYVSSVFDVAHDAGLSTSITAGKTKFWLFEQSYGPSHGAPDPLPPDHGRAKIDFFTYARETEGIARVVADRLRDAAARRIGTLDFVHFAAPDAAGHAHDWILAPDSRYFSALLEVDAALGTMLAAIDTTPGLAVRTAIVLTTDHGGGAPAKTHTDVMSPLNFRIPLLVWEGGDGESRDLYEFHQDRARPTRETRVARDANPQPLRNTDAGNLALELLGLPAIPGSTRGLTVVPIGTPVPAVSASPDKSLIPAP
jgi:predicted AlkP superfamily pyrophosphatase or phosphodiesterase